MPNLRTALLGLSLVASTSDAQVAPDAQRLLSRTDTLLSFVVRGADTIASGSAVDRIERVHLDGREVIRRIYTGNDRVIGPTQDTLWVDARTLRPIRNVSQSGMGTAAVDYGNGRITGVWVDASGDSTAIDETLTSAVYASSAYDLVLRAIPMREGWTDTVPTFLPSSREVVQMPARIVGRELVGGTQCWRVDARFQTVDVTFWVHPENRTLCQQMLYSGEEDIGLLMRAASLVRSSRAAQGPQTTEDSAKVQLARRLLEVAGSAEAYLFALRSTAKALKETDTEVPPAFYDSLVARSTREIDDLLDRLVPVYLEHFSASELRELIAFYESPLGRLLVSKQPLMQQRSALIGQAWGMELGVAIGAEMARMAPKDP